MKTPSLLISCMLVGSSAMAAETSPGISAKDLAAKLSALQQDGSSFVRLKLDVKPPAGAPKFTLQLQIKQRRTQGATEVVYQVLWPKERAGEAILLRQKGNQAPGGSAINPAGTARALGASQMMDSLFGSDLSYADVLENFFAWENQSIGGTEIVNYVTCQILDSKPGKGQHSAYSAVRTWVDTRRFVPMRIEKYQASSKLVRRFDTTQVATDDINRFVPANLTISSPQKGSTTDLDGSKLKHGGTFSDAEFTPAGLGKPTPPGSTP